VVVVHIFQLSGMQFSETSQFQVWAFMTVVGFFIHSGYLIAWTTLLRMKSPTGYRFKEFLLDRTVRIYICLIPVMLVILGLSFTQYSLFGEWIHQTTVNDFVATLLMIENHPVLNYIIGALGQSGNQILHLGHFGDNLPLWTLVIEWWMYLALGWWMLNKGKTNTIVFYLILCAFLSYPLYELFFNFRMGPGLPMFWVGGIVLVWWLDSRFTRFNRVNTFLALLLLVAFIYSARFGSWQLTGVIYFVFLMFSLAFLNATDKTPPKIIDQPIKYLAGNTLTLYLIHFPLIGFLNHFNWVLETPTLVLIYIVIINVVTATLAQFTEQKYKTYRAFLYKRLQWNR
jgi:peptidoglycan/LPS O-acetylase OafA/YrhL